MLHAIAHANRPQGLVVGGELQPYRNWYTYLTHHLLVKKMAFTASVLARLRRQAHPMTTKRYIKVQGKKNSAMPHSH